MLTIFTENLRKVITNRIILVSVCFQNRWNHQGRGKAIAAYGTKNSGRT